MRKLTVGSLFAGIGGLELGLERAGMEVRFQVEIDPFCRSVLARHWPNVRRHDDVRTFPPSPAADWAVDLVCGGFPCPPVSVAGKRRGSADERWMWPEFARVVRLLRPRFVLVENVAGLLTLGLGDVLGSLAGIGYDAEWTVLRASDVGAPHRRARVFIIARLADPDGTRLALWSCVGGNARTERAPAERGGVSHDWPPGPGDAPGWSAYLTRHPGLEPAIRRGADGVPAGLDPRSRRRRLRALGNAVVPQVAEWIGRRIVAATFPAAPPLAP